jgi:excisionase family DNA binding protein
MDGLLGNGGLRDVGAGVVLPVPAELVDTIARRAAELVINQQRHQESASPLLTIPEAAELLRCKRHRIDDLLSQRRLTRHKDGSRTLVSRAEVEAYIGLASPARRRSDNGHL